MSGNPGVTGARHRAGVRKELDDAEERRGTRVTGADRGGPGGGAANSGELSRGGASGGLAGLGGGDWRGPLPIIAPHFLASPGNQQALGGVGEIAAAVAPALGEPAGREGGRWGYGPHTVPTDMGPASLSHHPSIGRG